MSEGVAIGIKYPPALCAKLHAVMEDVAYIERRGENKFHGYRYASEADIKNALHSAFVKHKVLLIPAILDSQRIEAAPTAKGKPQWVTDVVFEYTFLDVETGEGICRTWRGQGLDSEDKGLYKAITGCLKYLLTSAFLIETGDDPEAESDQGQRVKAAQRKQIEKVASKMGQKDGQFDVSAMIKALGAQKKRLVDLFGDAGERKYREVLRSHGVAKANDRKLMADPEKARALWRDLQECIQFATEHESAESSSPEPEASNPGSGRPANPGGGAGLTHKSFAPGAQRESVLRWLKGEHGVTDMAGADRFLAHYPPGDEELVLQAAASWAERQAG